MGYFQVDDERGIRMLRFDHGKANTIQQAFVDELRELLDDTQHDDGVAGLLVTGKPHFFSAGLDIPEVYSYDNRQFEHFWESFMSLIYEMASFDKPMVAAVTGHAPAGGCILAMGADYRVMAEGPYKIGLNEVPVGIIVPPSVFHLYAYWIGSRRASQYLLTGELHSVERASEIGLIDEVAAPDAVEQRAVVQLEKYVSQHQGALRQTKRNVRKELLHQLEVRKDVHFEQSLHQWWRPEVREMLQGFIDQLKA